MRSGALLAERLRKTGIAAVGDVAWGTHICQFYETKQDLLDILVPYFRAGLGNNESCIWVTSEPLGEREAEEALRKAVPDFAQYLERGQIEIVPYARWYLKDGVFDAARVLNAWIDKLNQALASGYDGIRVTGNTSWLEKKDLRNFTEYEKEVDNIIGEYRMLVLCTYPLGKCGASEIIDAVSNHEFTLIKRGGKWEHIESADHKQVDEILQESDKKYRSLFESMLEAFAYCKILVDEDNQPVDFVHLEVNNAWERLVGLKREDVIGKKITEVIPGIKESKTDLISIFGKVALTGEATEFDFYFEPLGKWFIISVYSPQRGYFIAVFENITERKQAEESQVMTTSRRRVTHLQKRFIESGFEGFEDQEVIELLFSLVLSSRKSKQLTKESIEHFKNLRGFLGASLQELERAGITAPCMFCIKLLHELPAEVLKQRIIEQPVYSSSSEMTDYLYYSMRDLKKEVFKVIYLNNRNQIIDTADLFEGTLESIPIRPREIVESAFKHNATALIFAHNHPAGDPAPSKSDKQLTRDMVFIGMVVQIKVLDHIIIGENTYFSFVDKGLIQKYEDDFLNLRIKALVDSGANHLKNLAPALVPLVPLLGKAACLLE